MADRLLGILRHQALELSFGLLVLEMSRPGPRKDRSKLRPRIRGAHIDNADCLHPRLWRFDAKQSRLLPSLDTAPELPLGGDDEVLIEWIGVGFDLNPLPAAGDDRKNRCPGRNDPHVVLQLRHVLLGGCLLGERPRQHELGLKDRPGCLYAAVERGRHPANCRVLDMLLHVHDGLAGIDLIPAAIELLSDHPKLDNEVPSEVLRLGLTPLLAPQTQ
jgi:hypothetical protein